MTVAEEAAGAAGPLRPDPAPAHQGREYPIGRITRPTVVTTPRSAPRASLRTERPGCRGASRSLCHHPTVNYRTLPILHPKVVETGRPSPTFQLNGRGPGERAVEHHPAHRIEQQPSYHK